MKPDPIKQSTPAPRSTRPSPKTSTTPDMKCPALRGAARHASFEEQEAALAPTWALAGQPEGTARQQAHAATAQSARMPQKSHRADQHFGRLGATREAFGAAANQVSDYLPTLMASESNPFEAQQTAEARVDYSAYRKAEAMTASLTPMWAGATAVAQVGDPRFDAAMMTLESAQLVRSEEGVRGAHTIDDEALGVEAGAFVEATSRSMTPPIQTDGGRIALGMSCIHEAGTALNEAIATQRALLFEDEARQAAAASRGSLGRVTDAIGFLGDVTSFVSKVTGVASGADLKGALGLAHQALRGLDFFRVSRTLEMRAKNLAQRATEERESAGWFNLIAALERLENAQTAVDEHIATLDRETAATAAGLHNMGAARDERDDRGPCKTETHAAIGLHLGKVLEAQRFNAASLDAWRAVESPMAAAQATAAASIANPRDNWQLRHIQDDARAEAMELDGVASFRNAMERRYAERQQSLASAVKTVVSQLCGFGEQRSKSR